jgi:hypothetical protein
MTISSKNTIASRIRAYLRENPKAKPDEVVKALGVKRENVYSLKQYDRLRAKRIRAKKIANQPVNVSNIKFGDNVGGLILTDVGDGKARWVKAPEPLPITMIDPVNHPEHYKVGGIETIDFIKAKLTPEEFRGYLKGNVLKYASRAGHKDNAVQDAGKLAWYANRLSKES